MEFQISKMELFTEGKKLKNWFAESPAGFPFF